MLKVRLIAIACAVSLLAAAGMSAEKSAEEAADTKAVAPASIGASPVITSPSVISRPALTRPDEFREAMVYVSFLVSEEGIPTEIQVRDDRGFYTEPYRKLALQYVRAMRFRPATRDGVPMVYGPMIQPIKFGLGLSRKEEGVTPEFRRELNKVAKLMKDGDYAGAHFHAEWMLREKVKLSYEFAVLQAQMAQTLASVGRTDEALAAAKAATSRTSAEPVGFRIGEPPPKNDASRYLLPRELIVYLLELRMRLLVLRGDVLGALKTYNELAGLEKLKPGDPRTAMSEKLVTVLQSGSAIVYTGEVTGEFWSHDLYHPRFTTRNVQGKLDIVDLHCRGHYAAYEYEAEKLWTVPPGWESCVVEFYGERGAKLELVELPAA